jgi:hypothetical protein
VISGKQQDPYATVMPSLVFGLLSRFENKMKKIDLGQAIQVANVGVIAGIVFLGVEIPLFVATTDSLDTLLEWPR